jgi:ketosteroid isomerase-like protein
MSGRNLELARRWFERTGSGDVGEDLWHPDLVIENAEGFILEVTYRGHDGLRQWWEDLSEVVDDFRIELDEARELDDGRVLSVQRLCGRFKTTGLQWDASWASVMTFRDGKVAHARGYLTKNRALRDLGL